MKKIILGLSVLGLLASSVFAKNVKQTICFSKEGKYLAMLGDNVKLQGGKCLGKTLPEMNKAGWKLIQVVGGLNSAFGMVLEK